MSDLAAFDSPEVFVLATKALAAYTEALRSLVDDMVDAGLKNVIRPETLEKIDEAGAALKDLEREALPFVKELLRDQKLQS